MIYEVIDEETAQSRAEERRRWKNAQPEWIWVEMKNEEIVKELIKVFMDNGYLTLTFEYREIYPERMKYKIIKGKLYKKIKNLKKYGVEVISTDE